MPFVMEGGKLKWFGECPICHSIYRGCRRSQPCDKSHCGGFVKMVNLNAKATNRDVIQLRQQLDSLERRLSDEIPILVESVDDM